MHRSKHTCVINPITLLVGQLFSEAKKVLLNIKQLIEQFYPQVSSFSDNKWMALFTCHYEPTFSLLA